MMFSMNGDDVLFWRVRDGPQLGLLGCHSSDMNCP